MGFGRVLTGALVIVSIGACGGATPEAVFGRQAVGNTGPDVAGQNLSPDKELDALMSGKASLGKATGAATRIAVPPFKVLGGKNAWMGEGASVVMASRLSREDGVSVLDRSELTTIIDELKRSDDPDPKKLAQAGKLLGAQQLLLGTMVDAGGDKMRVFVRPVRVQDGVVLPSSETVVRVGSWMDDLQGSLGKMVPALFGENAKPASGSAPPLGPKELEAGARARALQYEGNLIAAQPLYEQALDKPSSAWGLEADYVRLMNDLGMTDFAADRAKSVMARMPTTGDTSCDRARLQIEVTRNQYVLDDAREAVRLAASCGDKVVEASALRVYGLSVRNIDYKMSLAAWSRAKSLLGTKEDNAFQRAWIEYNEYDQVSTNGLDEHGSRADQYAAFGNRLAASGNLANAAWAYEAAMNNALYLSQRKEYLEKGLAYAQRVGGSAYDGLRLDQSEQLRNRGQLSEADKLLQSIIGERVNAIAALTGGIPSIERGIDEDRLTAGGVKDVRSMSAGIPEDKKLLVRAHRLALANALRWWATRTDPISKVQAKAYRKIADQLDPPRVVVPDDETPEQTFQRKLDTAKITMKALAEDDAAPLRASVTSLYDAQDAVWDHFWDLRGKQATDAELRPVVDAVMKIAIWQGSPRLIGNAYRLQARTLIDRGKLPEAEEALKKARAQLIDAPWYDSNLRAWEIEAEKDAAKQHAMRLERAKVAKTAGLDTWVSVLRENASSDLKVNHDTCDDGVKAQLDASKELDDKGEIENAASALWNASLTMNECLNADGSPAAVAIREQRATLLGKLNDPLRSLQARADVLAAYYDSIYQTVRAGVDRQLKEDPLANAGVRELRAGAEKLAAEGRYRDAARVASKTLVAPKESGALLAEALEWTKKFEDSVESPVLSGNIHLRIGDATSDGAPKMREYTLARELFKKGKSKSDYMWAQAKIIRRYTTERELIREIDKCIVLAAGSALDVDSCFQGFGAAIIQSNIDPIDDKAKFQSYVKIALDAMPRWLTTYNITYVTELRTAVANVALLAGDMATYERIKADVRKYYTETSPDAYQWVTFLSRISDSARATDFATYFKIEREFEEGRGASDFWRAGSYAAVAATARGAKDKENEAFFLERGREAAVASGYEDRYHVFGAATLLGQKKWRDAAKKYEETAKLDRGRAGFEIEYVWAQAEALAGGGDLHGASAALAPLLTRFSQNGDRDPAQCFASRIVETAAALASASRDCHRADELRARAEKMRALCTTNVPLEGGRWTDGPDDTRYRAPAKCGGKFVPSFSRLPQIQNDERPAIDKLACDSGDLESCASIGWDLSDGTLWTRRDPQAALALLTKTCNAGNTSSCLYLGDMYIEGKGIPKEEARGYGLIHAACEKDNNWYACRREGQLLLDGIGTKKDLARAVERLGHACTLGSDTACELWIENGGQP